MSIPSTASASEYRHLCTSAAKYCVYTDTNVPLLRADVCLLRDGKIRLKGTSACPAYSWPYFVEHGEVVDPLMGRVVAYIPLDDACAKGGLCVDGPPPDGSQEFPMCCAVDENGNEFCVNGVTCGGTLWYCYDGVSNSDGTVTCFAAEQGA